MRILWLTLALGGCATDPVLEKRVTALETELAQMKTTVDDLQGRLVNKREVAEQEVVGKEALLQAEKWIQGESSLADGEATLLVFFEEWCPHCKREVPKLEETYKKLHADGLNIVGVTRLNRGADEAKMQKFVAEHELTFPILKDDGTMGEHYAVTGVPAVALLKGGKVVWRGNPAKLHENMLIAAIQ